MKEIIELLVFFVFVFCVCVWCDNLGKKNSNGVQGTRLYRFIRGRTNTAHSKKKVDGLFGLRFWWWNFVVVVVRLVVK